MSTPIGTIGGRREERRFDGGAWLTLAVAVAWIAGLVVVTQLVLQTPSDGWSEIRNTADGTYRLTGYLADGPTLLQPGDVVIGINGQLLTPHGLPPLPPGLRAGQTVRYTVQRGAQTLEVDVVLVEPRAAGLVNSTLARWRDNPRDILVALLSFLVVGFAFLMQPRNLGARYLLLVFSFYFAVQSFGFAVSELYAFTWPPALFMLVSLLPSSWGWYFFPSLVLMPLAFPVVKYPLRRFPRLLPALLYGVPLVASLLSYGLVLVTRDYRWSDRVVPVFIVLVALTVLSIFGSLIHNWLTLRDPVARAQLRWVTLGMGAGLGIPFLVMLVLLLAAGNLSDASDVLLWLMLLLPVSLAVAITRYRLFDIDILIRRTLVYSILTALLALVYFGGVVVLQSVLRGVTGPSTDLAIVLSTLAIAVLFAPLRRGIQELIDRRFYRRKYDAARTLAAFGETARDETDLDRLAGRLVEVARGTMQPEHASLWLRPPGRDRGVRATGDGLFRNGRRNDPGTP